MASVTQRISQISQPRGGLINPKTFSVTQLNDDINLYPEENIHPGITGLIVDYLTRLTLTSDKGETFNISLIGANIADQKVHGCLDIALEWFHNINGIDDESIINARKLVSFDVWFRDPTSAKIERHFNLSNPNAYTLFNIKIMIQRSIHFFNEYGPAIQSGFTFEPNGYTPLIDTGDGDFLTEDTLWDFKVSKSKINSKQTLQLMTYYIMGKHSGQPIYDNIQNIGIFNPRLNIVFQKNTNTIDKNIYRFIEHDIIGYK